MPTNTIAHRRDADELATALAELDETREILRDGYASRQLHTLPDLARHVIAALNAAEDKLDAAHAAQTESEYSDTDARAEDGYHAFATALGWRYPDGEDVPIWAHLTTETRAAFVACAKEILR